jgi:hypothetical protein
MLNPLARLALDSRAPRPTPLWLMNLRKSTRLVPNFVGFGTVAGGIGFIHESFEARIPSTTLA